MEQSLGVQIPLPAPIWLNSMRSENEKLFDLFLEEVRLTYGDQISQICRNKLIAIESVDDIDEIKILEAAKQEAGFDPDLSSLSYGRYILGT